MSWEAELIVIADGQGLTGSPEAAAALVGQEAPVTIAGSHKGLVTIIAARYVPGEGIYATIEFGDDTPLGAIEPPGRLKGVRGG